MSSHRHDLLGQYVPGTSVLHRCPLVVKAPVLLGLCLAVTIMRQWPVSAGILALTLVVTAVCGLGVRRWVRSLLPTLPLVVILAAYHLIANDAARAADVVLSLLAVLGLSRLLIASTPLPRLIDGLVTLCRPLALVGIDPERIGLAVAMMLRSVPWLAGCVGDLREAAAARTVRVNPVQLLTPAVISTVNYAHRTGEALAARGLD